MNMAPTPYSQDYTDYQLKRSRIRKRIRQLYFRHTLKYVNGKTIDFGCGIGELLARLPEGSIGLEVNETSVEYCKRIGLDARLYQPELDGYEFKGHENSGFKTFIMAHVLEHIENAHDVFRTILQFCNRLGIERVIIVVPGIKGFYFDKTHRTFIDYQFFEKNGLNPVHGYSITKKEYFPLNFSWIGRFFIYHELIIVYDRTRA